MTDLPRFPRRQALRLGALASLGGLLQLHGLPCFAAAAAPTLVSEARAQAMAEAFTVTLTDLGRMRQTPRFIGFDDPSLPRWTMERADVRELAGIARRSQALLAAPNASQCRYEPGYQATFYNDQERPFDALLLCFNCSVLALADPRQLARNGGLKLRPSSVRYADAKPALQELVDLVQRYKALPPSRPEDAETQ